MLELMNAENQLDLSELIGCLTECLEHNTVSIELHQTILDSVVAHLEGGTEPAFLQNVANMLKVMVRIDETVLPGVVQLLPILEGWRKAGTDAKFGYQDVLANIASLYLQIVIRAPDFPEALLVAALAEFPPEDIAETDPMARAIVQLAGQPTTPAVLRAITLGIARLLVWDSMKGNSANLNEDLSTALIQIFVAAVKANEHLYSDVRSAIGRQSWKVRKIEALLS
jgi:hypothetical protein